MTDQKKCAREQIMDLLTHFPEDSIGYQALERMKQGRPLGYTQMEFLTSLCKGMGLNVFPARVISKGTYWFVSSSSKHSDKLTKMYEGKGVYYPIAGLVALDEMSLSHSATHLFDEDIILSIKNQSI